MNFKKKFFIHHRFVHHLPLSKSQKQNVNSEEKGTSSEESSKVDSPENPENKDEDSNSQNK